MLKKMMIFFSFTAASMAVLAGPPPEKNSGMTGSTYGAITACNVSDLHCGPAILLPVLFHSLTDSDFGYHLDAAVSIPDTKKGIFIPGEILQSF